MIRLISLLKDEEPWTALVARCWFVFPLILSLALFLSLKFHFYHRNELRQASLSNKDTKKLLHTLNFYPKKSVLKQKLNDFSNNGSVSYPNFLKVFFFFFFSLVTFDYLNSLFIPPFFPLIFHVIKKQMICSLSIRSEVKKSLFGRFSEDSGFMSLEVLKREQKCNQKKLFTD